MAVEETKRDLAKRALIAKHAGQNERQKKHREKAVQKEILEGLRDESGKMKKKQKVSDIDLPFACESH